MRIALENDARALRRAPSAAGTGVKLGYSGASLRRRAGRYTHFAESLGLVAAQPPQIASFGGADRRRIAALYSAPGAGFCAVMTTVTSDSLVVFQLSDSNSPWASPQSNGSCRRSRSRRCRMRRGGARSHQSGAGSCRSSTCGRGWASYATCGLATSSSRTRWRGGAARGFRRRRGAARRCAVTPWEEILLNIQSISGVMKLENSLVLVHDLERFLSIEDHEKLRLALDLEP